MKCPECETSGKFSKVQVDSAYEASDIITTEYRCSNGHRWTADRYIDKRWEANS